MNFIFRVGRWKYIFWNKMMQDTQNVCFLLGVLPRTGTNYVANLIECHTKVIAEGPLWEDFFVSNSSHLTKFADNSLRYWNSRWDPEGTLLNKKRLFNALGRGLLSFINEQKTKPEHQDKLIIAKTPTVRNLANFFELFPENKLIIVVRDGRNIIASGEKSFRWDFDKASRDWARGINNIMNFIDSHSDKSDNILLLKYEDVYNNTYHALSEILTFLSLDQTEFDWDAANNLGISGSSETVDKYGEVSWQKKSKKTNDFKPLERFGAWSTGKRLRFSWLAGNAARRIGYDVDTLPSGLGFKAYQLMLTMTWPLRSVPRAIFYALKEKRFILKSH